MTRPAVISSPAVRCACARNTDGSVTAMLCPVHAEQDPCWTMARVTGRRRRGTIRRGICTACGWAAPRRLTVTQRSALGDLHRFGRLYPPGPRQMVNRGTPEGFSKRTLEALVAAGHARWDTPRDGCWVSIVPVSA